jgi:TonB family protein
VSAAAPPVPRVDELNRLLARRRREIRLWQRRPSLIAALLLHALPLLLVLGQSLFAQKPRPLEFVPVQLIPAAALQAKPVPRPTPAQPARPAAPKPAPPPPPRDERPALPAPEPQRKKEPPPPPPAETETSEGPQAAGQTIGLAEGSSSGSFSGFDNPEFTYGYYVDRMLAAIRANWVNIPIAENAFMILHFRIQSDGRVTELEVVQSSGNRAFDLAGVRAVQSSSPLPPLPRSYRYPSLGVNLRIP